MLVCAVEYETVKGAFESYNGHFEVEFIGVLLRNVSVRVLIQDDQEYFGVIVKEILGE